VDSISSVKGLKIFKSEADVKDFRPNHHWNPQCWEVGRHPESDSGCGQHPRVFG